ncbi:MAG: hypothetical protein WCF79_18875, partial [Rhodomicrobium sp.]
KAQVAETPISALHAHPAYYLSGNAPGGTTVFMPIGYLSGLLIPHAVKHPISGVQPPIMRVDTDGGIKLL